MSRNSAQRKHDLTADECQKALVRLIRSFSHGHHLHTVFSDFVELSALAISNSVDLSQYEPREKRYLDIIGKYKREEVERFPQMLGLLTESFEMRAQAMRKAGSGGFAMASGGLTDVLGETYMMLELGNARAGQFFTPYHVSRLMAMMTIGDGGPAVRDHGFIRVQEPACGAGGMVMAVAESLHDAGHNYQQAMHATCIDVDPCCVHMAYVQLALLHIPAVIVHGNALTLDVWGMWYTPAHILGGWRWKLRRREAEVHASEVVAVEDETAATRAYELGPAIAATCNELEADVAVLDEIEHAVATQAVPATVQASSAKLFVKVDQLALF
ncbi:N-6 DNA methylase [Paraburkholderia sp. RL17-337-BIB-A]|uniref:N-6 DNA methylase n=1 Tax=Paraburkholderia sp. RL17-337-BIB-A TaxID=3031636 RepID=UPI0038BC33BA